MKNISIAIDGPSGVGKTTASKLIAKKFGYIHVDTGAMFRTLGVFYIENGIDIEDESKVEEALGSISIDIKYENDEQHMYLNGTDVTGKLRTEDISHAASVISQYKAVRAKLLEMQREIASKASVVMDGRDIGTVVLPDAKVKIFLTASPLVRAKRRYDELLRTGKLRGASLKDIEKDIKERDYRDSHRELAPLKPAENAVTIDTSELTADEVAERIAGEIK